MIASLQSLCHNRLKSLNSFSLGFLDDTLTSTVLGVVAYRQHDLRVAKEAFTSAIARADDLLAMTPDRYAALDAKALALCGLALSGDGEQIPAALAAFTSARKVTSAPGVVKKVLLLFDALAQADKNHILADLRPAAAGSASERPAAS